MVNYVKVINYFGCELSTHTGVDEMCVMTLQFPNKGIATLCVSTDTKLPNELNIQGLKGRIKVSLCLFI